VTSNGRLGGGVARGDGSAQRAPVPPEERGLSCWQLIAADYRTFSELRSDSKWKRRLLALPRIMLNPSLHLVVLIRVANASPRWLHWFWRNIMVAKHSSDFVHRSYIGPGLLLPHPYNLTIGEGVRIGERVVITHNVSIGTNVGSFETPVVGDRCVICTGSGIFGGIEVGADSLIGVGSLVNFDVGPNSVVASERAKVIPRQAIELRHGVVENL
jgi:serine acetyltransferase